MTDKGPLSRGLAVLRGDVARRFFALIVLSLGTGAFVVEYAATPIDDLRVGSVADRSVRATASFPFVDWEETLERQRAAEARVQPVFDFDTTLPNRVEARISDAFDTARHRLSEAEQATTGRPESTEDRLAQIRSDFQKILDLCRIAIQHNRSKILHHSYLRNSLSHLYQNHRIFWKIIQKNFFLVQK